MPLQNSRLNADKAQNSFGLILFVLFAASLFLRMALISKGPFHIDCLNLAINAEKTLLTGRIHFLFGPGYPFTVLLGSAFVLLFRCFAVADPVIAVNFMSVFFSALCVPLTFHIAKTLFNKHAAWFSAIMLSVLPLFLALSVYGKSHIPSLFFLLAGIACLLHYLRHGKTRDLVLSSISIGLLGACRLQDMILMILPLSLLLVFSPFPRPGPPLTHGKKFRDVLLFGLIALIFPIVFHLPFLGQGVNTDYSQQFSRFYSAGVSENVMGLISPALSVSLRQVLREMSPLGLLTALGGSLLLLAYHKRALLFLVLWALVPFAFYGNLVTATPRFFMISLIPLIMAQGYLFSLGWQSPQGRSREISVLIFCLILAALLRNILPILNFRHHHAPLMEFAQELSVQTEENAVIIAADEHLFISHYSGRKALVKPCTMVRHDPDELMAFKARIDQLLAQGVPVYITHTGLHNYDPHQEFSGMIKGAYALRLIGEFPSEDWHQGATRLNVGMEKLYQIRRR